MIHFNAVDFSDVALKNLSVSFDAQCTIFNVAAGLGPTLSLSPTPCVADEPCTATCEVNGSRPAVNISWEMDGEPFNCASSQRQSQRQVGQVPIYDTTSTCDFNATNDQNGATITCTTEGHNLTELNKNTSSPVNVTCKLEIQ